MSTAAKSYGGSLVIFVVVAVLLFGALGGGLYLAKQRGKIAVQPSPAANGSSAAPEGSGNTTQPAPSGSQSGPASPPASAPPATGSTPSGNPPSVPVPATGGQNLPATGPGDSLLPALLGLVGLVSSAAYYLKSRRRLRQSYS